MKNKLLLSLLLGFGSLNAWSEPEPSPSKLIQVQVEFIELPHKALTKLLFLAEPKTTNGTALRKKLQEMVEKDEAEVLETQVVVCKNGRKATNESIQEFIYPTEYEPPDIPGGHPPKGRAISARKDHATPLGFETTNLGSTLEVETILTRDEKRVELRFLPEMIWHTGNTVWLETKDERGNVSKIEQPDIYKIAFNTSVTCVPAQYLMASVLSPKNAKGDADLNRKVMVFVKCDVLTPE